jgi:hypothetical protein
MSESHSAKRVPGKNRFPISLNHRLDGKLLGYSVAAAAAGVGMLALPRSEAEIVYTAASQTIHNGGSITIDLNNDGITDFTIHSSLSSNCFGCILQLLYVSPAQSNGVWAADATSAMVLPVGQRVGPADKFNAAYARMAKCKATYESFYSSGAWLHARDKYLGLSFSIDGQTHYGWARLSVREGRRCRARVVLTGYAYVTVPGEPILTGIKRTHEVSETDRPEATLGVLALGSVALEAWRRDEDTGGNSSAPSTP